MALARRLFFGSLKSVPVHLRPVAGVSDGAWSFLGAASLPAAIADDNDASYAFTAAATPGTNAFVVQLAGVTDPLSATGQVIRFKGLRDVSAASFKMSLYDGNPLSGGSLITQFTQVITGAAAIYAYTLTSAEANAITEAGYNAGLYLRGEAL